MEGIPEYMAESDRNNPSRHNLSEGDVISGGMGDDVEVLEIDDEGVRFDDGTTGSHIAIMRNMNQVDYTIN